MICDLMRHKIKTLLPLQRHNRQWQSDVVYIKKRTQLHLQLLSLPGSTRSSDL